MKRTLLYLSIILVIAGFLRLYLLGKVPPSPDWDEVALGYNAYSIMLTGKDEYGKSLPIILRSFDDYKPALYAYLTVPFMAVIGLNTVAVRLPSAVLGILTVMAVFYIVRDLFQLTENNILKNHSTTIALMTSLLLALSPWHIQFSRIAFESNLGLSFNIFGLFFFLKGLKKPFWLPLSAISFSLSLYVYQSEKVFTPLFVLILVLIYRKKLLAVSGKFIIITLLIGIVISFPLYYFTFSDKLALTRAKGVSVFSDRDQLLKQSAKRLLISKEKNDVISLVIDNRRVVYAKQIVLNYLSHYDLNWLFVKGDLARHHAPDMGLMYIIELPFFFIGIYQLVFGKWRSSTKYLLMSWFFIAPIPASITSGVPHAVRTLNFLPTFQIFITLGFMEAVKLAKSYLIIRKYRYLNYCLIGVFIFLAILNFAYYLNQYFVQQNYEFSQEWQYGYEQAAKAVKEIEPGYEKIIVSNTPHLEQSYMFFLFYLKYPPQDYQIKNTISGGFRENHTFGKFEFRPINWKYEIRNRSVLYVGRPQDFDKNAKIIKRINFLDGKPAIYLAR